METNVLPKREIELDFIRGVAILLVLDYHSSHPLMAGPLRWIAYPHPGWIGVDIFFVLSGFLIGGLLIKEWKAGQGIDSKRFLIRRALKIWPQYYIFILFMILTGHLALSHSLGNLLNVQNYWFGVSHTWSLAVEEHVYLLLLGCFLVAARRKIRLRLLGYFFISLCVATIGLRYLLAIRGMDVFFPTQTRLDGIVYGLLLAMVYHFAPLQFARLRSLYGIWIVGIVISLLALKTTERTSWLGAFHQDAAHLFAVSLVLLLYRKPETGQHGWLYRLVAWIGIYSYGIYLWHTIFIRSITSFGDKHPAIPPLVIGVVLITQGVILGYLTSTSIEFPVLKLRDRLFPKKFPTALA